MVNKANRDRERSGILRVSTDYGDVVLNETTGTYWHLNESATLALEVFQQGGSQEQAVTKFVEVFQIDPQTARADIAKLNGQLRTMGLT